MSASERTQTHSTDRGRSRWDRRPQAVAAVSVSSGARSNRGLQPRVPIAGRAARSVAASAALSAALSLARAGAGRGRRRSLRVRTWCAL